MYAPPSCTYITLITADPSSHLTQYGGEMLAQCGANVEDVGTTLCQHFSDGL